MTHDEVLLREWRVERLAQNRQWILGTRAHHVDVHVSTILQFQLWRQDSVDGWLVNLRQEFAMQCSDNVDPVDDPTDPQYQGPNDYLKALLDDSIIGWITALPGHST